MSPALIRVSCEILSCFMMVGKAVTAVKTMTRGIRTENADLRGIPQSL